MYSTWFSVEPRGYCDFNFRFRCVIELKCGMGTAPLADSDECCDEIPVPVEGVFDLELGFEVRSVSETMPPPPPVPDAMGDGLAERCDIDEAEREFGGSDDRDVFRVCAIEEKLLSPGSAGLCADAMSPWLFIFPGVGAGRG